MKLFKLLRTTLRKEEAYKRIKSALRELEDGIKIIEEKEYSFIKAIVSKAKLGSFLF